MRIRKRKVPFPLSSLLPVTQLSDPHLTRSPIEQLQLLNNDPLHNFSQEDDKPSFFDSDQLNHPIGGQDSSKKVMLQEGEEEKGVERENSNDSRNVLSDRLACSMAADVRCGGEGEKSFALKKRRGRSKEETILMEKDKKLKNKMNKKCMQQNGNKEEGDDKETCNIKKRVRVGALMEGSRCSRVNGRGWRCCQQTLVGYSLCEHHLGKGRLRSMTSVRNRSKKSELSELLSTTTTTLSLVDEERKKITLEDKVGSAYLDEEEKHKPLVIAKKKQKLGIVKARLMSSLLGYANNAIDQVAENDK